MPDLNDNPFLINPTPPPAAPPSTASSWSLDRTAAKVKQWHQDTFGSPLPIHVYGLDAGHKAMGFKYHDAMDVGISPKSPQGQALSSYLKSENIPFSAWDGPAKNARGEVISTGTHFHIGPPGSRRGTPPITQSQQSEQNPFLTDSTPPQSDNPFLEDAVPEQPAETAPAATPHTRFGTTRAPIKPNRGAGHQPPITRKQLDYAQMRRNEYPRDLSIGELRQAEDVRGRESTVPAGTDIRVLKGEQPLDRLAHMHQADVEGRSTAHRPTSVYAPPVGGSNVMQSRQPGVVERLGDLIRPHVPGLTSLDTPMGVKTDPLRGATSLGLADFSRTVSPEELQLDPEAQRQADFAYGVGKIAPAVLPYVGAGKLAELAIPGATRLAAAERTAATFGGVDLLRQGTEAAQTGKPVDLKETIVSTLMGGAMGSIAGIDPSMKRQIVAFLLPQVSVDVARGTPIDQAVPNALTTLGFALTSGAGGKKEWKPTSEFKPEVIQNARQTETQRQGVQAEQPTETSRAEILADTLQPRDAALNREIPEVRGTVSGTNAPQDKPSQRFFHKDWGDVTKSDEQVGARRGRTKVYETDDPTKIHYPKTADLSGSGNQRMVPIKEVPAIETRTAESNASAVSAIEPVKNPSLAAPDAKSGSQPLEVSQKSGSQVNQSQELSTPPVESRETSAPLTREIPATNYRAPLSDHAPTMYREASPSKTLELLPTSRISTETPDVYLADNPDLALGQGGNKGVMLEFDASKLQGQINQKPGWQITYQNGAAEYRATYNKQREFQDALTSVTVRPDAKMSRVERMQMDRALGEMEQQGWTKATNADGSVRYEKPSTPKMFRDIDRLSTVEASERATLHKNLQDTYGESFKRARLVNSNIEDIIKQAESAGKIEKICP